MQINRVTSRMLPGVLVVASFGATAGSTQGETVDNGPQESATSQAVIAAAGRAQRSTITRTDKGLRVSVGADTIQIPLRATGPITSGDVQIRLPDLGGGNAVVAGDGTVVFRNDDAAAETSVQATAEGVRALVVAKNASAPTEYTFPVTLPPGGRLVSSTELLGAQNDTGEIIALDGAGTALGLFDPPWAKDAQGAAVPTQYRIEGSSIVQIVGFSDSTAFPVVIDPDFVKILKCAGAIAFALGASIVPGGAIIRFIRKVGSIKKAATIFVRTLKAAKPAKRDKALRKLLFSVGGSLTGIGVIVETCS